MKQHVLVYTAIFGNYDELRVPTVINENIPYYCIFDRPLKSCPKPWIPICYRGQQKSSRWKALECKLLSHKIFPDAETLLWIDGNIQIRCEPLKFMETWLADCDIAAPAHTTGRDCIYKEAQEIIRIGRATPSVKAIKDQVQAYRQQRYSPGNGLAEVIVLLRRHTPDIVRFNEAWWHEVCTRSSRTQMSFNYVSWKLEIPWKPIRLPKTDMWHIGSSFHRARHLVRGP